MTRQRALEVCIPAAALVALVTLFFLGQRPQWGWIALFALLAVVGENQAVRLPQATSVSPSFMAVMACIAVLAGRGHDVAVSAGLVGVCSALYVRDVREHSFRLLWFNAGQFCLAAASAALVFDAFPDSTEPTGFLVAALATAAYGLVNVACVLPYGVARHGARARDIWADMLPAIPNYLAFGLLGLLVGLVCVRIGFVAVPLLAVPMAVARWTFSSFLRTREAQEATVRLFVRLIEAKDPYTAGHTERVAKYAIYIAEELGLPPARVEHLRQAALMHDVGKLAVPSHLLNKPGRLTAEEFEVVRRHNDAGIGILSRVDFMRGMAVTASDKHGHYADAQQGAPSALVLEAHVVAVADAFDAMTSTRSYRQALAQDVAFAELRRCAGTQFNPDCVEALIRAVEKRGDRYGLGYEAQPHPFAVAPPVAGVGSAGLGDLASAPVADEA